MTQNTADAIPPNYRSTWEVSIVCKDEGGKNCPPKDEVHIFCNQEESEQAVSLVIDYSCGDALQKDEVRLAAMKKIADEVAFRLNFYNRTSAIR